MYLSTPAKCYIKYRSLANRIRHRNELKQITATLSDAEQHLTHHKQQLAFLYGLKAKRLFDLHVFDKCVAYLNYAIELITAVKKDYKDREALIVMLHNLIKIYARVHDYKAAAYAQEQVIELYREMVEAKETEVVATNWELQIKDQMLAAKDKKLNEQLADLQERTLQLEAATSELHNMKNKGPGTNGFRKLEKKLRNTEFASNTLGLAGDVGKLLGKHEYLGAFILAMTLFEHELVNWQCSHSYHFDVSDRSIKERLEAVPRNLFDRRNWQSIEEAIEIRHKIVHGGKNLLNESRAGKLIEDLSNIAILLRSECEGKKELPQINKPN